MSKREDLEALAARARAAAQLDVEEPQRGRARTPAPQHLPSSAVTYGAGLGVPASYVLVWIFNTYVFGGSMPPDVAGAFGSVIATGIAYLFQRYGPGEKP